MMNTGTRSPTAAVVTMILASAAVLIGFVLMRLSTSYESYLLLFVSFVIMVWGIMALFGRKVRTRTSYHQRL